MKQRIPDLLLVLATATAALSAASARRPWREVPVRPGVDTEEILAFDLHLDPPAESTRGRRLDAELATQLDALGYETVRVRNPAQPIIEVPLEEAPGQVLAAPVVLWGETETLRALPFAVPMSLGPRILRTETAAVAALSLWQALAGDNRP